MVATSFTRVNAFIYLPSFTSSVAIDKLSLTDCQVDIADASIIALWANIPTQVSFLVTNSEFSRNHGQKVTSALILDDSGTGFVRASLSKCSF